jgi:hypothetical protein
MDGRSDGIRRRRFARVREQRERTLRGLSDRIHTAPAFGAVLESRASGHGQRRHLRGWRSPFAILELAVSAYMRRAGRLSGEDLMHKRQESTRSAVIGLACFAAFAACSSSGSPSVSAGSFCSRLSEEARQCGDACTRGIVDNCSVVEAKLSAAYLAAFDICVHAPYECIDSGMPMTTTCIDAQMAKATPTAAHLQVKADFCKQCPDDPAAQSGPASCSSFFQVSTDAGPGGAGEFLLGVSDSLAKQIDRQCAGTPPPQGGADCSSSFLLCAAGLYNPFAGIPACAANGGVTATVGP